MGENLPFVGWLVERYPVGGMSVSIAIPDGRPDGQSRDRYESGQLEVEAWYELAVTHGMSRAWNREGRETAQVETDCGETVSRVFMDGDGEVL